MKKVMLKLTMVLFFVVSFTALYGQTPDKKSEKARENLKDEQKDVVEAKKDLKEAKKDSISDYQKFKKESEEKIMNNEKKIAEIKSKCSTMNEKDKASHQKRINGLEQKNAELKMKLVNYKDNGDGKWVTFKGEFNHDMDELGKALKDFTVDNKK